MIKRRLRQRVRSRWDRWKRDYKKTYFDIINLPGPTLLEIEFLWDKKFNYKNEDNKYFIRSIKNQSITSCDISLL